MTTRLKTVCLLGLGNVAKAHWHAYSKMEGVAVAAGVDPSPQARAEFEQRGIKTFATFAEMRAAIHVDIACVCAAVSVHESLVCAAASTGVHVICEKPLSTDSSSARRMVEACESAKVKLQYGSSQRFLPALVRARELIQRREIGEILQIKEERIGGAGRAAFTPMGFSHYPPNGPGGGGWGLVDHGIHMLDVFPWLLDAKITSVYGTGNRSGQEPRAEFAVIELNGGRITGHLIYNELTYPTTLPNEGLFGIGKGWGDEGFHDQGCWESNPTAIEVYGSDGSLRILGYPNALFLANHRGVVRIATDPVPPPIQFVRQMEAFIRSIEENRETPVPGWLGVRALEVLEAIYCSADTGQKIQLRSPLDPIDSIHSLSAAIGN